MDTPHHHMDPPLKLSMDTSPILSSPATYRRLIGKLLYLTLTKPDISYAVQHLSQFLQAPRESHLQAAKYILRYLEGTTNTSLFYDKTSPLQLTTFCDADWGNCRLSTRSLTGFCIFLCSSLVSWKTNKQKTTAKPSVEVEYRAMLATTSELEWLHQLLQDLHVSIPVPITMHCDNKVGIQIAGNSMFHEKTSRLGLITTTPRTNCWEISYSPHMWPSKTNLQI